MRQTVLIVDDEPHVRRLLSQVLERDGYEVLEAEDHHTALAAIRNRSADLALIDIDLPGPSGRQVAAALRRAGLRRSVFITGLDPSQLIAEGRLTDGDPLVRKPFTLAGVLGAVNAALHPPVSTTF